MSRLQTAIESIMAVYEEYGGEDGKLDVEEVKALFDKEIADEEVKVRNTSHFATHTVPTLCDVTHAVGDK